MARAGQYRDRVVIQRTAEGGDDPLNPEEGWMELIEAQPARITPLRGSETVQADRLAGTITYEIELRASAANRGIRAEDRAVNARTGEVMNIRHDPIDPDSGKGARLIFQAQSGVAT